MWSVGCVFGELITGKPIFPARNDLKQLPVVIDICGSFANTSEADWPELKTFTGIPKKVVERRVKSHFHSYLKKQQWVPSNIQFALDLLDKLLICNPNKRISASEACEHAYFSATPFPEKPSLPKDSHFEWTYNKSQIDTHNKKIISQESLTKLL
eukprot:UN31098